MEENVKLNLNQPIMIYAPGGHMEEVVLNFGLGRIAIDVKCNKETDEFAPASCVCFYPTVNTYKIGLSKNEKISQDDLGTPRTILSFTNEESIDVVIKALKKVKENFKNMKQ